MYYALNYTGYTNSSKVETRVVGEAGWIDTPLSGSILINDVMEQIRADRTHSDHYDIYTCRKKDLPLSTMEQFNKKDIIAVYGINEDDDNTSGWYFIAKTPALKQLEAV